jgi:hypothetical protein
MTSSDCPTRFRLPVGVAIGLIASAAVLAVYNGQRGGTVEVQNGPLLSDCHGTIRLLVIQYVAAAAEIAAPAYADFLGKLPPDVTVHVVCPGRKDFDDLIGRLGDIECQLSPVLVDHPMTCWSRDRWLALGPSADNGSTLLLSPRAEMNAEIWPARRGDQQIGGELAAALSGKVVSKRSDLYFDGGDFVADERTVFVTPAVLLRNLQQTVSTREELIESLSKTLKREVVLLRDAPDHHAGMYMMAVGDRTVLVGDPGAAREILDRSRGRHDQQLCPGVEPDFSDAMLERFEAVAAQCRAAGYRVVRVPIIPGDDGRTYITYLNVILDEHNGHRVVYMPTFSSHSELNRVAKEVWTKLGYEVRSINCDACFPHFGSLRCLVSVLSRD